MAIQTLGEAIRDFEKDYEVMVKPADPSTKAAPTGARTKRGRVMAARATRRQRYYDNLADQSPVGDAGAVCEGDVALIRDFVARGTLPPLTWCNEALAGVRKLRRMATSADEAWLRRQLAGLGKKKEGT